MSEFSVPPVRDLLQLALPLVGEVVATDEPDVPFTITDAAGDQRPPGRGPLVRLSSAHGLAMPA